MKPKGCGPRNLGSPIKQAKRANMTRNIKKAPKKEQSFISSAMDYISGKQGAVPDMLTGGKPTRQAMNESTLFNPRGSSEQMSDMADSRPRASLLKEKNKSGKTNEKMLNYYNNKAKHTRPNRKDRY